MTGTRWQLSTELLASWAQSLTFTTFQGNYQNVQWGAWYARCTTTYFCILCHLYGFPHFHFSRCLSHERWISISRRFCSRLPTRRSFLLYGVCVRVRACTCARVNRPWLSHAAQFCLSSTATDTVRVSPFGLQQQQQQHVGNTVAVEAVCCSL